MRKFKIFIICLALLLTVFSPSAFSQVITINRWDTLIFPGWNHSSLLSLDLLTDTPDLPGAIRFTYPLGYRGGAGGQGWAEYFFPPREEFWYAHWFKYPQSWQWHPDVQKITYVCNGECLDGDAGNFYVGVTGEWHKENPRKLRVVNQITWGPGTQSFDPNTEFNPTIEAGRWYRLIVHARQNTPGRADGLIEVMLDNRLVMRHNQIPYRSSSQIGVGFGLLKHDPIWGGAPFEDGQVISKQQTDHFWIDSTVLSGTDLIPPDPPSGLKIE